MNPLENQPEVTPSGFPATRWSLVGRAGGADNPARPIAIAELVRMYAPALRAHLLQILYADEHRADDLLQGFLADKVLEQQLIGHADPKRGRFRTFLLSALDRYVIDIHRYDSAAKRSPPGGLSDIDSQCENLAAKSSSATASAFDQAWAREVIGEALATMHTECERANRPDVWTVFDLRYLKPATEDVQPEPHEAIAQRLHLSSAQQAANLLITSKRMFTRVFKGVVLRYASNETEAREEMTDLWKVFATKGG